MAKQVRCVMAKKATDLPLRFVNSNDFRLTVGKLLFYDSAGNKTILRGVPCYCCLPTVALSWTIHYQL